jgi:hypothetical protein
MFLSSPANYSAALIHKRLMGSRQPVGMPANCGWSMHDAVAMVSLTVLAGMTAMLFWGI